MLKILLIVLGFALTAVAGGFVFLAHEYETVGFGLAPWVALPCAIVMIGNAWFAFSAAAKAD